MCSYFLFQKNNTPASAYRKNQREKEWRVQAKDYKNLCSGCGSGHRSQRQVGEVFRKQEDYHPHPQCFGTQERWDNLIFGSLLGFPCETVLKALCFLWAGVLINYFCSLMEFSLFDILQLQGSVVGMYISSRFYSLCAQNCVIQCLMI